MRCAHETPVYAAALTYLVLESFACSRACRSLAFARCVLADLLETVERLILSVINPASVDAALYEITDSTQT